MRMRIISGLVAIALLGSGCGSSAHSGSASPTTVTPQAPDTFVLSEFTILPPANNLGAGSLSITASNVGIETHELVIVRVLDGDTLPMKPDGSVDETKIPAADKVGTIRDVAAHSSRTATIDLTSGTYVAFCNVVDTMMDSTTSSSMMHDSGMDTSTGHVHYAQGMHVTFTVT